MGFKLRSSVILMKDKDLHLLGDSNLHSFEKMRLISESEFKVLISIDKEVELHRDDQINDIIRKWIAEGVIIEETDKYLASQKIKQLKKVMTAFKKVKPDNAVIDYHKETISNAGVQFDFNETTLSHLYRNKNKALNNLSYGEALCDKLIGAKESWDSLKILEIGCGTGLLAKNFLNRLKTDHRNCYEQVEYNLFDLSPALQEAQKVSTEGHANKVKLITGNIENYDFEEKFDLIICNEVIADLNVRVCDKDLSLCDDQVNALFNKYDFEIKDFSSKFLLNYQAIKAMEKITELLKVEGIGFISEYGSWNEVPQVVELPGHNEYSINFSHLSLVCEQARLLTNFVSMDDFLNFDKSLSLLDDSARETFSDYFLPFLGHGRLDRIPCEKKAIESLLGDKFRCFEKLSFNSLEAGKSTLDPKKFKALILKKTI